MFSMLNFRGKFQNLWGWKVFKQLYLQFILCFLFAASSPAQVPFSFWPPSSRLIHWNCTTKSTLLLLVLQTLLYRCPFHVPSPLLQFSCPTFGCCSIPFLGDPASAKCLLRDLCLKTWASSRNWGMKTNIMSVPPLSWLAHSLATPSQLVPGHSGSSPGWGEQAQIHPAWGKRSQLLALRDGKQALAGLCLLLKCNFWVIKWPRCLALSSWFLSSTLAVRINP